MVFTEQGVAMLSSVLKSNKAIEINPESYESYKSYESTYFSFLNSHNYISPLKSLLFYTIVLSLYLHKLDHYLLFFS